MLYLLVWAMPALLLVGVVTGAFHATRTAAGIGVAIIAISVAAAVTGAHDLAHGAYCDLNVDCPDANTAAFGGAFALAALALTHVVGRIARAAFDRLGLHDGISHAS